MKISELLTEQQDIEEGWKDWAAGATLGAAALGAQAGHHKPVAMWTEPAPSHTQKAPAAKALPALKATKAVPVAAKQVAAAPTGKVDQIVHTILKPEAKALISAGRTAGMKGAELAQFVAQCAHESANFTLMKEKGGSLDFKKYDPAHNPRKAKILGNKLAGDGAKYHGRGYIQLTGRDNYKRAGQALGLPLEQQPNLVERPDIAAKVAVWFWQNQVAPKVNNFNDTTQVTKPINSGLNGLEDRTSKFAAIMQLMKKV
jgi:predicted chitinase